jgi:elongation factor G
MHAEKKEEIKEVGAGDIAAAVGLENTVTGNTLCGENKVLLLEAIEFPETVISQAIEPKTNEDKEKLRNALEKLKVQDPSFEHRIDRETGQMIIAGMGELHLEILVERLRSEYKVNIETKQQKVAYRETIKNKVNNIKYLHKKQTGGAGERAEVHLDFEPNPGKGFEFVDAIRGEDVPKQFRPAVKDGLENVFSRGVLLGYPIVDVKVTLRGGA